MDEIKTFFLKTHETLKNSHDPHEDGPPKKAFKASSLSRQESMHIVISSISLRQFVLKFIGSVPFFLTDCT